MQIVTLLQKRGVELDDEMVRFVRANLLADRPAAVAAEPDVVLPPDVIDRGGPEPFDQKWTAQGEVGVKQPEQTTRI